jgi:hypothetical protein
MTDRPSASWLWWIAAAAAATLALAYALGRISGYPGRPTSKSVLIVTLTAVAVIALVRFLIYVARLWRRGEESPMQAIRKDAPVALAAFYPIPVAAFLLAVFFSAIAWLKSMIPAFVPFWADAPLAATDRLLIPFALPRGRWLDVMALPYGLWQLINILGVVWALHTQRPARPIIAYMLTWLIGMALAYAFSSAGPIFTGQYPMRSAHVSVRMAADFLLDNYRSHGAGIGGGISAFPSLHVAIATWFALFLRSIGIRWLGEVFLLWIWAASVILGWHYVLDGPAGIAVALIAWKLAGLSTLKRVSPQQQPLPDPAQPSTVSQPQS